MKSLDRWMIACFAAAIWITQIGLYVEFKPLLLIAAVLLLGGMLLGGISDINEKKVEL